MDLRNAIRKFAHIFRIQVGPRLGKRLLAHRIFLEKIVVSVNSQLQRGNQSLQQNTQEIFRAKPAFPGESGFFQAQIIAAFTGFYQMTGHFKNHIFQRHTSCHL